ncbi:MAG: HD domain-containing protein [Chloroflexi bacterium]|nr:HD domain-containing protein [Chloroflexota bacterium]
MTTARRTLKVIRDPIHNLIRIEDPFILELIDSVPMQRLRRVRQLGLAWQVFPGAEHSRFVHSLGVYHLVGRMMRQLNGESETVWFDERLRRVVLVAALLHDVGHGPFSHTFEVVARELAPSGSSSVDHETWTKRIVREHRQIQDILTRESSSLPEEVCQVLDHTFHPYHVTALVSSQLDADRFDYLLRDSYMTGTGYGTFDLEWMLRTIAVREVQPDTGTTADTPRPLSTIVVDGRRGLSGLEAHLMGRHYMYRQVYYHKTVKSAEALLRSILRRAATLIRNGALTCNNAGFTKLARGDALTINEFLGLDDFAVLSWIQDWADSSTDPTLKDLSARLMHRNLFKAIIVPSNPELRSYADNREIVRQAVIAASFDPEYYMIEESATDIAYKDYFYLIERGKSAGAEEIWYVDSANKPHPLSANSDSFLVVAARALQFSESRWFVPDQVARKIQSNLRWELRR